MWTPKVKAVNQQRDKTTRDEWGNKERRNRHCWHKLTLNHIRGRGDLPRIERLIKCFCIVEHCITRVGKPREEESTRMDNEGEIRMEDIDVDTFKVGG